MRIMDLLLTVDEGIVANLAVRLDFVSCEVSVVRSVRNFGAHGVACRSCLVNSA